ncbi:hypothetical protein ACWCPX_20390 [Streptomyces olivaceoviridis]
MQSVHTVSPLPRGKLGKTFAWPMRALPSASVQRTAAHTRPSSSPLPPGGVFAASSVV